MKERVGAALSLDKFATAKVSKYDKRKVIEKQRALKAKQFNKYKKLRQRLEATGNPLDDDMPSQHGRENQQHTAKQQQRRHQEHEAHQQQMHVSKVTAKRQQQQGQQQQHDNGHAGNEHKEPAARRKQQKPPSQLQRLADKAETDKAAKEQERQQREQALAERQRQLEQKKKQRSHQKHDFFKKTKHGQPIMKYRVDKILSVLEQEKGRHS